MKYLALVKCQNGENARIFNHFFDALNYLKKAKCNPGNSRIVAAQAAEYRLIRHISHQKDEERRFSVRENAVKFVRGKLGALNKADSEKGQWRSDDGETSYRIYVAILDRNTRKTTKYINAGIVGGTIEPAKTSKKMKKKFIYASAVAIAAASVIGIICFNTDWQMLEDERKARDYTPSAQIASTVDTLRLTRKGKSVFYATHPEFQDSKNFNLTCGRDGAETYTLGCYFKDEGEGEKLYIFDNKTNAFNSHGISYDYITERNRTALHELLHAVYERYDEKDQQTICRDLSTISDKITDLKNALKYYPSEQICTETFARIGSEYIASLSSSNISDSTPPISRADYSLAEQNAIDNLAKEYQRFFNFNYSLSSAHWKNKNQVATLETRLKTESAQIDAERNRVNAMVDNYYRWPTRSKYYSTNAAIDAFNERVSSYNSLYSAYCDLHDGMDSEKIASKNLFDNM